MFITLENVDYVYNPGTTFSVYALKNINLSIDRGEFIGIIGHTGSGKSTLIQHFNALLKPTSGRVLMDGEDINADKSKLQGFRRKVGLVFQYPEHQLFELTVQKDVSFGPEKMGFSAEETAENVSAALALVGLDESFREKSPFELSGGQKRRAAIAGVLAARPEVLVLDEPAAGLDPAGRDEILNNIREMHEKLGITVILVSHSMDEIVRLTSRVIVINNGEIAYDAPPAEIFKKRAELEAIGLSAPEPSKIIDLLRSRGIIGGTETAYTAEDAAALIYKNLK
ncbi:energy-coupling factor transporter ATP-binding protein EcfA [Clostridia bacterium]|nr:energy-coupling factor transporter ATP-binding protein EcfA [Clostridia bacterium]